MNQELIDQIRQITEKVLEEQAQARAAAQTAPEKRLLAIFGAAQLELDVPLQQLQRCMQEGWKITIILSELATKVLNLKPIHAAFGEENILQENNLTELSTLVDTYQQIVLPVFSYPMAAKLALKLVDTPCTYLVFEALRKGKKVTAAADALNQSDNFIKTGAMLHKLEGEYVNVLSELGVQWVTMEHIADALCTGNLATQATLDRPVISAAVVANLAESVQEVFYTNPAIITPLAREDAQKRGIKLIPKRGGN